MVRIIVDDEMRSKLRNLTVPLEVHTEDGYLMGRLYPADADERPTDSSTNGTEMDPDDKQS